MRNNGGYGHRYSLSEITYFAFLPSFIRGLSAASILYDRRNLFHARLRRARTAAPTGAFPSDGELGEIIVDGRIRTAAASRSAIRAINTNPREEVGGEREVSFVSGDDHPCSFFPPHLSNNANANPRLTMEFHLHLWTTARANEWRARVVMLLGAARRGEANARDGQRRSLKIESICALGLEIQIRREISIAARAPETLSRVIYI